MAKGATTKSKRSTPKQRADARVAAAVAATRRANLKMREIRAKYDAAQTTTDNRRHWAAADALSANAANSREVRAYLRNRARYEVANNPYALGIGRTLADECIGTGPRLQIVGGTREANGRFEQLISDWFEAIKLAEKLWVMRFAVYQDGEAFALMSTNEASLFPVMLDLQLLEAEQVAASVATWDLNDADGIRYDRFGNAISYEVLPQHPGDVRFLTSLLPAATIPGSDMLHYLHRFRPGQMRGVPEITPALPILPELRRYSRATLAAAETAAEIATVLETATPPAEVDEDETIAAMQTWELEKRVLTVMPAGYRLAQTKAEQPTTTYPMAKREFLSEIARCLNVPYAVAACDSSGHNYSSGRLDYQFYDRTIRVERSRIVRRILNPLVAAFIREASLVGILPDAYRRGGVPPHLWFWDGRPHVDPKNEASAQEIRLRNRTTSLAREYAEVGLDWEDELEQIAKEQQMLRDKGIEIEDAAPTAQPANEPEQEMANADQA